MLSTGPHISVVIPHLNQPDQLRRCLASIRAQSHDMAAVEVCVVDNGSTALPCEACSEHAGVRLVAERVPGPGPARNTGVRQTRGGVLAFIDADCVAHPDWLAAIASAFADDATQIVGGDVRIAVADPSRLTMLEAYESIFAYRQEEYITRRNFSGTGNLAMRRTVYEAVGPFAGIDRAEDTDWGHRATAMGYAIAYRPDMIVFHPARRDMRELHLKWDRHIAHSFGSGQRSVLRNLHWLARAALVAASPAAEFVRIARSRRVSGARERVLAFIVLFRLRTYRAWRMLEMLFRNGQVHDAALWNRR